MNEKLTELVNVLDHELFLLKELAVEAEFGSCGQGGHIPGPGCADCREAAPKFQHGEVIHHLGNMYDAIGEFFGAYIKEHLPPSEGK